MPGSISEAIPKGSGPKQTTISKIRIHLVEDVAQIFQTDDGDLPVAPSDNKYIF